MSQELIDFIDLFPEFNNLSPFIISNAIAQAKLRVDQSVWGDNYINGLYYLSAHLLSPKLNSQLASDFGLTGEIKSYEAKDDSKVEFYNSSESSSKSDPNSPIQTRYYKEFLALERLVVGLTFGFY